MKLNDFNNHSQLNLLRMWMDAPYPSDDVYVVDMSSIDEIELSKLSSDEGLEIDPRDVEWGDDGTLVYKGRRIVLYIRDRKMFRDDFSRPKYHVSPCRTIQEKSKEGKFHTKYVAFQTEEEKFKINIIRNGIPDTKFEKLDVCENCLTYINWKGFAELGNNREKKNLLKSGFSLKQFYEVYPKTLISIVPKFTPDTAPLNVLPSSEDWQIIRKRELRKSGYRCQRCSNTSTLEVHHKNGQQNENNPSNLEVLCHACHANEHSHY